MGIVSPGFKGRPRSGREKLPPGQYLVTDFPVLSAGPTPRVKTGSWEFRITTETGEVHTWDWAAFQALPAEEFQVDLHCVTKWSKLHTTWRGVSLDTLLAQAQTSAEFALARSYGGYTTNLPLADLLDGQAWVAVGSGTTELLLGVWGAAPNDVWAVGRGTIIHWDGQAWSPRTSGTSGGTDLRWPRERSSRTAMSWPASRSSRTAWLPM